MKRTYRLYKAITLNISGRKEDVLASRITIRELQKYRHHFQFDFISIAKHFIVYKMCLENQPDIIQGLVAFRLQQGFLDCVNMEINEFNKHGIALYSGVGKSMVALCCKVSLDEGMEGYISFEAKNRLIPYYQRLGAQRIGNSKRMFIDDTAAQKLIALYF
jgi:hypothetical protein